MKFNRFASPTLPHPVILSAVCFFCLALLSGCDTLGLPNLTHHDEVPPQVKAEPRVVETAPSVEETAPWPRLGDVPFKPKDFTPKPAYDHYFDELTYDRAEAQDEKARVEAQAPHP